MAIAMPNQIMVQFTNKPIPITNRTKLRCNKTTVIPAKTVCFLHAKIPICTANTNYEGLVEPYNKLADNKGIFITGAMSYSNKNMVPIYCINAMPWDVTIYKKKSVSSIY